MVIIYMLYDVHLTIRMMYQTYGGWIVSKVQEEGNFIEEGGGGWFTFGGYLFLWRRSVFCLEVGV